MGLSVFLVSASTGCTSIYLGEDPPSFSVETTATPESSPTFPVEESPTQTPMPTPFEESPSPTPEATETPQTTETPEASETPQAIETPEPTETPQATETPEPTEPPITPEPSPDSPLDGDGDGYLPSVDCDDTDPLIHPGQQETCDDGVDNNCDGNIDEECEARCETSTLTSALRISPDSAGTQGYGMNEVITIEAQLFNPCSAPVEVSSATTCAGQITLRKAVGELVASYPELCTSVETGWLVEPGEYLTLRWEWLPSQDLPSADNQIELSVASIWVTGHTDVDIITLHPDEEIDD